MYTRVHGTPTLINVITIPKRKLCGFPLIFHPCLERGSERFFHHLSLLNCCAALRRSRGQSFFNFRVSEKRQLTLRDFKSDKGKVCMCVPTRTSRVCVRTRVRTFTRSGECLYTQARNDFLGQYEPGEGVADKCRERTLCTRMSSEMAIDYLSLIFIN